MKTYHCIIESGNNFLPEEAETKVQNRLKSGAYTIKFNHNTGKIWFQEFKTNHDQIIDLPSPEFKRLTKEMTHFLNPETKKKFESSGFLYKRSALLYGLPGTGKTVLVNRVIKEVLKNDGVVIFADDPRFLSQAYQILDDLQPETITLVIMEEFDNIIKDFGETVLLSLLDGQIQKQNIMYLTTTNYIENIPLRMIRPGRMSSVIEVKYPNVECRRQYFSIKMGSSFKDLEKWVEKTSGLSVDELKEVVQSVYIFEEKLEDVVQRIKKTRDHSIPTESEEISIYEF